MFDFEYRALNWFVNIVSSGSFIFITDVIIEIDNIDEVIDIIISFIDSVWFGTIATKYENITNIPPI